MYAPLVKYHKPTIGASSHEPGSSSAWKDSDQTRFKRENVLSNESSLVSVLHYVSCDYHRNCAKVNDAKNNGSRPLGLSDVEDRIRKRAVTLIGGDIDVSITTMKPLIRPKKRRRRSWQVIERGLKKSPSSSSILESESVHSISFLQKLNVDWNKYILKVLLNNEVKRETLRMSKYALNKIAIDLGALRGSTITSNITDDTTSNVTNDSIDDSIDLIGAHVKIKNSNSHTSWIGKFGVLIGETKNTYQIASYARTRKKKEFGINEESITVGNQKISRDREGNGFKDSRNSIFAKSAFGLVQETKQSQPRFPNRRHVVPCIETIVLPKPGSSLQLILPLQFNEKSKMTPITTKQIHQQKALLQQI